MQSVFVLQHLRLSLDGCENIKLIGVYHSYESALGAVDRKRKFPGFCEYPKLVDPTEDDDPNGFYIDEYKLDHDYWSEGFSADE